MLELSSRKYVYLFMCAYTCVCVYFKGKKDGRIYKLIKWLLLGKGLGLERLRGFSALSVILYTTVHPYFICVIKNQSDFKYVEPADYIF